MQGEMAKANDAVPRGALHIIRQLGLIGLYKGAGAWYVPLLSGCRYADCLSAYYETFPFLCAGSSSSEAMMLIGLAQAIYFTSYPHLKTDLFGEGKDGKKLGPSDVRIAVRPLTPRRTGYTETLLAASIAGMPSGA
jgi:solute carrier family 25 aspartate/glutamate transporter 12/13